MTWRSLAAGLLAGVGLLAGAASADAGDTVRLKLTPGDTAPAVNLKGSGDDADVMDVAHRGSFHGGFHGSSFHSGFHGGFHHSFHGGFHHGFHSGFHRGFVGFSYGYYRPFYRGYYASYYYPRYYYPYYATPYYYAPSLYCDPLYPIGGLTVATPSFSLRLGSAAALESVPYPQLPPQDDAPRTYPYDGGPAVPVPMPKAQPEQLNVPRSLPETPADRAVSLPASGGSKFAYPAYGDKPQKTQFAADRVEKKKDEPVVKKAP